MRIAVMGTGGVGGYFGGLLAQSGEDVTFIARGEHLKAIQTDGLQIESVHGNFVVKPAQATDNPAATGKVDAVLFATKSDQLEDAAEKIKPMIGDNTVILPLQNGMDSSERLAAVVGEKYVLGGTCHIVSLIGGPGKIVQTTGLRRITLGELNGEITPRVQALADALRKSGAEVTVSENIQKARWTKFVFIAAYSGVGAVARATAAELSNCKETRDLVEQAVREGVAVASASGVELDADVVEKSMAILDGSGPGATSSMQRDIIEGKPSELESQNGYMVRRGAELGVPVPAHAVIYATLLPQERRARSEADEMTSR